MAKTQGAVPTSANDMCRELREGRRECFRRGLNAAAAWASEVVVGIAKSCSEARTAVVRHTPESDIMSFAKTLFDMKEYMRAVMLLQDSTEPAACFLRCYSLFLAGEKQKEERITEIGESMMTVVQNCHLATLREELEQLTTAHPNDGFLLYLRGLVLKELLEPNQALEVLQQSVDRFPCNWSAWSEICAICTENEDLVTQLRLPEHWIVQFMRAHLAQQLHNNEEGLGLFCDLRRVFPSSCYVLCQQAICSYQMRDFDEAEEFFDELLTKDPHRLTDMDKFSHILYVKEQRGGLSFLAQRTMKTDKFRPETCVVAGNHYALKGNHEKAVLYFRRALKLNRRCLAAWTLMGHEYVELKNTAAAVAAYRRVVDLDPKDFFGWYGLGQTYEILKMPLYSLFYYQKTCQLQPKDSRMWCAAANCYESLGQIDEAVRCYRRADQEGDAEGIALIKLAKLTSEQGDAQVAAQYHLRVLALHDGEEGVTSQEVVFALIFLAKYFKEHGEYTKARSYCQRLMDCSVPEKEDARVLLAEIAEKMATEGP